MYCRCMPCSPQSDHNEEDDNENVHEEKENNHENILAFNFQLDVESNILICQRS